MQILPVDLAEGILDENFAKSRIILSKGVEEHAERCSAGFASYDSAGLYV